MDRALRILCVAAMMVAALGLASANTATTTLAHGLARPARIAAHTSSADQSSVAAIDVSPTQVMPGQTLTVTGTNFSPNESITVFWDGLPITTTTPTVADGSGSFVAQFTVPDNVPGSATVAASGDTSGLMAQVAIQVLPLPPTNTPTPGTPTNTPTPGTPTATPTATGTFAPGNPNCNGTYTISGTGFGSITGQAQLQDNAGLVTGPVTIIASSSIKLSGIVTGTVDANGNVNLSFTVTPFGTFSLTGTANADCSSATIHGTVIVAGITVTLTRTSSATVTPTPIPPTATPTIPGGPCSGNYDASGNFAIGPITGQVQLYEDSLGTLSGTLQTTSPLTTSGTLSGTVDASGNVSVTLSYLGLTIPLTGTTNADCSSISLSDNSGSVLGQTTTLTLTNSNSSVPTATPTNTPTLGTPTDTPIATVTTGPTGPCTGSYAISGAPIPISGQAQLLEDLIGAVTGTLAITSPLPFNLPVTGTIDSSGNVTATLTVVTKTLTLTGTTTLPDCSSATLSGFVPILGGTATITLTRIGSPQATDTPMATATATNTPAPTNTPPATNTPAPTNTPPAGATVPSAPGNVTATAGDGVATVSWTPPDSDGGSAISDYKVYVSNGNTFDTLSTATSFTVTNLTDGTAYTFTVTALNAVGEGPQSAPSNAVTPLAAPTLTPTQTATQVPTGPCTGTYDVTGAPIPISGQAQLLEDLNGNVSGPLTVIVHLASPLTINGIVTGTVDSGGTVTASLGVPTLGVTVALTGATNGDCSSATLSGTIFGVAATITLTRAGSGAPTDTPAAGGATTTATNTPAPTDTPAATNTPPVNTATFTPVPPAPSATNTSVPPATSNSAPANTPVPPAATATSTPVQPTAASGRTAGVPGACTSATGRLALDIGKTQRSVAGGDTLAVSIRTAPRARVALTLQVVGQKVTLTGKGKKRPRIVRTVVLYQATFQATADAHGKVTVYAPIKYKTAKTVTAAMLVTARNGCATAARKGRVTILPPRPVRRVAPSGISIATRVLSSIKVGSAPAGCAAVVRLAVTITYGQRTPWTPGLALIYQPARGVRVLNGPAAAGARGANAVRFALLRPGGSRTTIILKLAVNPGQLRPHAGSGSDLATEAGGMLHVMRGKATLGAAQLRLLVPVACATAGLGTPKKTPVPTGTPTPLATATTTATPTATAAVANPTATSAASQPTAPSAPINTATATAISTPVPPTPTLTPVVRNCSGTYNVSGPPLGLLGQGSPGINGIATLIQDGNGNVSGTLNITAPIPSKGTLTGTVASDGTVQGIMTIDALGGKPITLTGTANADCSSGSVSGIILGQNVTLTLIRQ